MSMNITRFHRRMAKPASIMAWLACLLPSMLILAMGLLLATVMGLEAGLLFGGGACLFAALVLLLAPLLMFMVVRVMGGNGGRYLAQVAERVGGEVERPTLLWAFLRPGLYGQQLQGMPFSYSLIRMGGLLAPADPGRSRLLFGWMAYLDIPVPNRGYVAFAPPGTADRGMSILGLNGSLDGPGVKAFWGDERGRTLLEAPGVLDAGRALIETGSFLSPVVRVGPNGLALHGRVQDGATPDDVADTIRKAGALVAAVHGAAAAE
jgi:hypothetical protein